MRTFERIIFALIVGGHAGGYPGFGSMARRSIRIPPFRWCPGAAWRRVEPEEGGSTAALRYSRSLRCNMPRRAVIPLPNGSWAGCMPMATASRRTICGRLNISAASPTRMRKIARRRRRPRSSPMPSLRSGRYYLNGIPNSKIKQDTERAREMFSYAASYFGNADAQYDLARLYLRSAGRLPRRFPLWRALARAGRPEGPASGPGACSVRCCSTATSCRGRRRGG